MEKPFYESKTFWANTIALVVTALNSSLGWLNISGDEAVSFLAVANLVLRAVTKGGVTLT